MFRRFWICVFEWATKRLLQGCIVACVLNLGAIMIQFPQWLYAALFTLSAIVTGICAYEIRRLNK